MIDVNDGLNVMFSENGLLRLIRIQDIVQVNFNRGFLMPNRKTGVILSYILMVFEVLSTLLLTPAIIRTLGDAEYGVYKLSASIAVYLLLLDLGIGNSVTRFVAKYRVEGNEVQCRKFLGITTIYYVLVAGVCLAAGFVLVMIYPAVFAKGLSTDEISLGQKLLLITTINAAVTLGGSGFRNSISAYERFDISRGVSIVVIIFRALLTIVALKLGFGSIGIVCANLLLTIITVVFYILFVVLKLNLKPIFRGNDKALIKEIVSYSSFILLQMVATQINVCLDSILIGIIVESSTVTIAVYSVGQQITQYFQSIGSSVTGVLMPGVVRMVEKGANPESLCREMIRIGRMILMVLGIIWACFLVFGRQFIILWVGSSKLNSFWVAFLLMSVYTIVLTESIGTQILWAKNEHKEQSVIKISVVLLNIVLTILLIKWNPLFGATIGTAISLILGDVVAANFVFMKKIKINLLQYYLGLFRGIVPCIFFALIAGFAFSLFGLRSWIGLALNIMVMVVVYGLCMILFGMNQYEKNLLLGLLHRSKND